MDGTLSTYGAANLWDGGEQDLGALRGEAATDTGPSDADTGGEDTAPVGTIEASGCGCASSSAGSLGGGVGLLLALGSLARRRRLGGVVVAVGLSGCVASGPAGEQGLPGHEDQTGSEDSGDSVQDCAPEPEVCNGVDDDCDGVVDDADPDLVDGLPFYVDDDGDGYGASEELVGACALADGLALLDGDCDDTDPTVHPDAVELCDDTDQDCDGLSEDGLGEDEACPAPSCAAVLEVDPGASDGPYWLRLPSGGETEVWCDMEEGGWTLGFVRNSVSTGSQGDFGAGEESVEGLRASPDSGSADDTAVLSWLDLNELDYDELLLTSHTGGSESSRSEPIPRDHLRLAFGEDGYFLYGGDSPYVWCGGDAAYTDGGVGAVNNPSGAPAGCRGHSSLGSGWDFSTSTSANQGLTLCGGDGYSAMTTSWGGGWVSYGGAGAAQAIWVR